jgi:hypothetical protein
MSEQLVKKQIMMKLYTYRQSDKKNFGIAGDLTFEDIQDLFKRQEGKCYVCKDLLLASGFQKLCKYQISVDRLNNALPHERTNVLLSCYYCNCAEHNGWIEKYCECHPEPRIFPLNRYEVLLANPELTNICLPYRNEERKNIVESLITKQNKGEQERILKFQLSKEEKEKEREKEILLKFQLEAFNTKQSGGYSKKKEERERILKLQLEEYNKRKSEPLFQLYVQIPELQARRNQALINGTWSESCEIEQELQKAKAPLMKLHARINELKTQRKQALINGTWSEDCELEKELYGAKTTVKLLEFSEYKHKY